MNRTVSICTPTFNSERFLDATMQSVLEQEGDFRLHYHIQDGGSTDGTLDIIRGWMQRVESIPRITLSMDSAPDTGMYQAINRGFESLPVSDSTLMAWINSDDLLAKDAAATALAVIRDVPEVDWIGTLLALVDERDVVTQRWDPDFYSRGELIGGLYTGRDNRPFVQQEGSFWRPKLWNAVGGLDASFRLAGDWDLWRRFAEFASLTLVARELGFHRRHQGQLSDDLAKYHAEADLRITSEQIRPAFDLEERVVRVDTGPDGRWRPVSCGGFPVVEHQATRHRTKFRRELSRINRQRLVITRRLFGRRSRPHSQ